MSFIKNLTDVPSYSQKGIAGFPYDIENPAFEIYSVDVQEGHDPYIISKKITQVYYTISGKGVFNSEGEKQAGAEGMLIEVLAKIEYTYYGKMKMLMIGYPPWFEGNEEITKTNPNVK
jgi:hypothetical protein